MSTQSDIDRSRKAIQDLQRKIGLKSGKVAAARQKAARARQAAQRSNSQGTIRSKLSEADREDDRAIKAESERAKLEGKVATEQKKLHDAEAKLAKEQTKAQERSMKQLRSSIERSTAQFRPTFTGSSSLPARLGLTDSSPARAPTYDVFISHASEDKEEIATPLAEALRASGLSVWFDAFELQVGDSLRRKIDQGLGQSTFGVVILSEHFFAKEWPRVELDGLTARATESDDPMILPIWHHVSKSEVIAQSPTLAGLMALNTAVMTLDEIVEALVRRVRPDAYLR